MRITLLATAFLAVLGVSMASDVQAAVRRSTSISAQGLGPALETLAKERNFQILYVSSVVDGLHTNGAAGELTDVEALTKLLSGTGLTFKYLDEKTVTVVGRITADNSILVDTARSGDTADTAIVGRRSLQLVQNENQSAQQSDSNTSGQSPEEKKNPESPQMDSEQSLSEEIVVTGTRLRSGSLASPVTRVDRDQFTFEGAATVQDAIGNVPSQFSDINAFNSGVSVPLPNSPTTRNQSGGSAPNIHGLGANATLTLLNGVRLPSAGEGFSVDVSMIPLLAVESIDVLSDGASPIYGSDAIGGVVNIITRRDTDGAETSLRYSMPTQGGGEAFQFGQALGSEWSSGEVFAAYQYDTQANLEYSERDQTANLTQAGPDILPRLEQHALFGSLRQSLTPTLHLGLEGLFSQRDNEREDRNSTFPRQSELSTDQRSIVATLGADLSNDWRLGGYARYADSTFDSSTFLPSASASLSNSYTGDEVGAGVSIDGSLLELGSGAVDVAFGADYRTETRDRVGSIAFVGGPTFGTPSFSAERDVTSVFLETNVPIVARRSNVPLVSSLELSFAARYDEYSDFGGTTNPRVGVFWELVPGLRFRGAYSESFRAPSLAQSDESGLGATALLIPDPLASSGTSVVLLVSDGAAPNLQPETSHNVTLGMDWAPDSLPGFEVHVTYFDIEFDNRLSNRAAATRDIFAFGNADTEAVIERDPAAATISEILARTAVYADFTGLNPGPGDFDVLADLRLTNLSATTTRGIDLQALWSTETQLGTLTFDGAATYIAEQSTVFAPGVPEQDFVGNVFFPPNLRARAGASLTTGPFVAGAAINYTDGFEDQRGPSTTDVSSWTTVDLNVAYYLRADRDDQTILRLHVSNVFDEDPPRVVALSPDGSPTFDPSNANVLGRVVSISLSHRW